MQVPDRLLYAVEWQLIRSFDPKGIESWHPCVFLNFRAWRFDIVVRGEEQDGGRRFEFAAIRQGPSWMAAPRRHPLEGKVGLREVGVGSRRLHLIAAGEDSIEFTSLGGLRQAAIAYAARLLDDGGRPVHDWRRMVEEQSTTIRCQRPVARRKSP
jgi:hypothetical protein